MHKRTIFPLFLVIFMVAIWLLGHKQSQPSAMTASLASSPFLDSIHQSLVDQFEVYMRSVYEKEPVPALAYAIVMDDRIIEEQAWGVRSLQDSIPIDEHTVFRLASLSKGFAPVLAGIMVEKGMLDWTNKIIEYVPELKLQRQDYTQELSLEHVLSHTTGLPRHTYSNLVNMAKKYEDILPRLKEVTLTHTPGTYYNYQNVAFSLSGDVMEKAAGKSYEELMEELVFRPAGMRNASMGFETMDSLTNKAHPHRPNEKGYYGIKLEPDWYTVAPAAGINASIRDMAKWLQLLMGGRPDIIADRTLDKIFTPYVSVSSRESNVRPWRIGLEASWYALGWRIVDYNGSRIIYHGGYVNGYRTEIAFDRESKIGVVILSSSSASFISQSSPVFFDFYRETVLAKEETSPVKMDRISRE